jgi:hypothetical protein
MPFPAGNRHTLLSKARPSTRVSGAIYQPPRSPVKRYFTARQADALPYLIVRNAFDIQMHEPEKGG